MPELDADFEISNNNHLEAEYTLNEGQHFDCSFEIYAAGTTWPSITGDPYDNQALSDILNQKASVSSVESISDTIETYGDIVTHNADEFATAEQGQLADTALQSGDNITELVNNAGFITSSVLDDYVTDEELATALEGKQDVISDLSDIRSDATEGASAYNTIQNYGDIVTYNASSFATSSQGTKADSALQPNDNITELVNNAGYITSASLPTVNNATVKFQKNGTDVKTITLNQSSNETINFPIPTQASDINAVPTSRTINSKSLANNISLNSTDVGALSSSTTINDLTTTAQQNALNSGATSTNISQITTNKNNIEDIQDVIPSAATSSNQLADKSFVNSSIATNTSNFIGTFTSVADLEAYSGTLTNNDYAFVETTDTAGNTLYDRYKYTTATTPASWQYEYELNNSSFTADQWAAVNSGANTTNIGQITTNANDIIRIDSIIGGYGDIVSYNASAFATSVQGGLADTALQPNDNISELNNDSGYITGITSTDVTNALGYTPYDDTNPTGYITGITSNDVTTALGYTPYDSSNPDGYTSNVGTVTDVQVDNTSVVTSGVANIDLTGYAETSSLATVAISGSYNDLIDTPTIPSALSDITVVAGSNISISGDTISATDTTYSNFIGADSITGGTSGLVPAPLAGDEDKFLKANGNWDTIPGGGGASRNIGEIVASTIPLTDAGLHLLDGALISGSGSYSAFVTYIAGLYNSGDYTAIFETEANWQTAVTANGVCGKFVYDSVNNTVRLPKYDNKIYTKAISNTAPVIGNGIALGLTDGTNYAGTVASYNNGIVSPADAYGSSVGTPNTSNTALYNKVVGVSNDPTKSGIIADLANITTPLDGYYYIVTANTTKTEIEVDIDEIVADLNGKLDTDLTNMSASQSAKNTIVSWGTPDFANMITVATSVSTPQTYTAPSDGIMIFDLVMYASASYITLNGADLMRRTSTGNYMTVYSFTMPVGKNDIVGFYSAYTSTSGAYTSGTVKFVPLKGVS